MVSRKIYLSASIVGILAMTLSQFMANSQFYGAAFGRAWAHVFWLGFLVFTVPLIALCTGYVALHKNPLVRDSGKYQVMGIVGTIGFAGLIALFSIIMGDRALTGDDGDARRGVLFLWLIVIVTFTVINLLVLLIRLLRREKRY